MRPVLVKAYGHMKPFSPQLLDKLRQKLAYCGEELTESFSLNGNMLLISYEGVFFPEDEVVEFLRGSALENADQPEGRLDYLDLEAWMLHRHEFSACGYKHGSRSLNNVLDYSGH